MYRAFIGNAEYYGMPVGLLRAVGKSVTLDSIADDKIQEFGGVWNKTLSLRQSTYVLLADMNVDKPYGEQTAILGAYHESTHAYLYLKKDDPLFKKFSADGQKYYVDAPLENGKKSQDPERLFQEAVSAYIGNRAARWWATLENLSIRTIEIAQGGVIDKDKMKLGANKTRDTYNKDMKDLIFGYEGSSPQVETTRPISAAMKQFIDTQILEGKIPDSFDRVNKFSQLYRDMLLL
jgi:hypothetical protein